jgi:hypothetical protein
VLTFDRRPALVGQLVGLVAAIGLSGYLTYIKSTGQVPPCTIGGGCAAALYSRYGKVGPFAVAYIGLTASLVLLGLCLLPALVVRFAAAATLVGSALVALGVEVTDYRHTWLWVIALCVLVASAVVLVASFAPVDAVRALALTMTLVGAAFTIWLRYVEQAYLDGHVCMWCVMFMIAWWFAGVFELRRHMRPYGALADAPA